MDWIVSFQNPYIDEALTATVTAFEDGAFKDKWGHKSGP